MRLTYPSMLALAALACMASDGGGSGGGPSPEADAEAKAKAEAEAKAKAEAEAKAKAEAEAKAAKTAKTDHVVWCAPGYERYGIGRVYKGPAEVCAQLQAVGKARIASKEEVKAAGDQVGAL